MNFLRNQPEVGQYVVTSVFVCLFVCLFLFLFFFYMWTFYMVLLADEFSSALWKSIRTRN